MIDIAAPGGNIKSSVSDRDHSTSKEAEKSGTSQAAPFITSIVATMRALDYSLTPADIETCLKNTADIPYNWKTNLYGAGIVDFYKAIETKRLDQPLSTQTGDVITITLPGNAPEGTLVFYTTDGSTPIPHVSNQYTAPISLSSVRSVTAITWAPNQLPSLPLVIVNAILPPKTPSKSVTLYYKGDGQVLSLSTGVVANSWRSNDSTIASVSSNGYASPGKIGRTTITAYNNGATVATFDITVTYNWWQWLLAIFF